MSVYLEQDVLEDPLEFLGPELHLRGADNYYGWHFRVEMILTIAILDGWKILQPDYVKPTEGAALEQWKQIDAAVRRYLVSVITRGAMGGLIGRQLDARGTWEALAARFKPTDIHKLTAVAGLLAITSSGLDDVEPFLARYRAALGKISCLGYQMDEHVVAAQLLRNLPPQLGDLSDHLFFEERLIGLCGLYEIIQGEAASKLADDRRAREQQQQQQQQQQQRNAPRHRQRRR